MASNATAPQWDRSHMKDPAVLIIGAGISGLCAAIDLIRFNRSRDFLIIEKGNQVGGTWNDNKYPGCCCDVWSHLYSLSFEPNSNWSREYPGQEEIHQYLIGVAQKWGLYRHIRFNTEVEEARWQENESQWQTKVRVSGGKAAEFGDQYILKSDYLVSCVGQLNQPYRPDIGGLSSFKGTVMHSARWNWSVPMEGKRIAVIGNGATAAQIVPELAKIAKALTVFQRTPNWIVPRSDQAITKARQALYKYIPAIRQRYRASLMDFRESWYDAAVVEDSNLNTEITAMCTSMMKSQLTRKPELAEILTPNYPPGCKRIIISDDYYPALNRPNVDLETNSIVKVTENGIITGNKELEVDVIILATGFLTEDFLSPIKVFGVKGRPLQEIWSQGPQAYLGITVSSLPNFAMLYGPNTNLGHNSIILMIEAQSRYVARMVAEVLKARERGETLKIVPLQAKVDAFNKDLQERLQNSTFASDKCRSWYKNEAGVVINNWSGNVVEYQKLLSSINWSDFELSGTAATKIAATKSAHIGRVVEESRSWLALAGNLAVITSVAAAAAIVLTKGYVSALRVP